jgi:hypothetical protein
MVVGYCMDGQFFGTLALVTKLTVWTEGFVA